MSTKAWAVRADATGVGSLPGESPREAARIVAGELPELPHVPELPSRGPWADIIGRGCALLVDLPTEVSVGRWQLTGRIGRDQRRARSMLAEDLDALAEALAGFTGAVKVQVCGPMTLAATIEKRNGERALGDAGARRDIAESIAEGLLAHLRELKSRLPEVSPWVVQLDEPALPMVVAGSVPTASGYSTIKPLAADETRTLLGTVTAVAKASGAHTLLHCCAEPVPIELLTGMAVDALGVPVESLQDEAEALDRLGEWLDTGRALFAGVRLSKVHSSDVAANVALMQRVMNRVGLPPERVVSQLTITPECGLAAIDVEDVAASYQAVRETARRLRDDPEGP